MALHGWLLQALTRIQGRMMRRTIFLALSLAVGILGALALARTAQALTVSGSLKVDLGEVEPGVLYRAGSF
jgi:hypothetical protein